MLEKLNKLSPYAVFLVMGYLTYSVLEAQQAQTATGPEMPAITRRMLQPSLLQPVDHASPVGRNPFQIPWGPQFPLELPEAVEEPGQAPQNAVARSQPAQSAISDKQTPPARQTQPANQTQPTKPATEPARTPGSPPLPGPLSAIVIGGDVRGAIISNRLYVVGEPVDSPGGWILESVGPDRCKLRFGKERIVMELSNDGVPIVIRDDEQEERE